MSALLLLLALASPTLPMVQKGERWPKPDERIECGPLVFEVYVSPTAHVFHLVDQIAAWDNACHAQYRRNMQLSPADEELLRSYAELRQKKRWGQGLEQTFYTPFSVDDAVRAGLKADRITDEQAQLLERVLDHFAERAQALLEEKRAILLGAFAGVDRARFAEAAGKLARFTGVKTLTVPTFPIASPEPGGGGMDGGRLRWELCDERIEPSVLLHEATHGFFLQKDELLQAFAGGIPGMSMTLLGEGFAYAVAPGMYPFRDGDVLASNVAQDRCGTDRWNGKVGYGMQRMYGLALRPLLEEAFVRGDTLEQFLPRARDAYLAVDEIMMAEPSRPPTLYIAGEARDVVRERLDSSKYQLSMQRFNLGHAEGFARARAEGRNGDLLVVLVSGEDPEQVPEAHRDLLPLPLDELQKRLRAHKIVEEERAAGALRVVLLAAPTTARLEELARTSALLDG